MDSFAGSEPLKFISFRLGTESNGQPAQTDKSHNGSGDDELDQRSSVVQETASATVANRTDEVSPLTSTGYLPTGIEIIEGSGTQSSTEQKSSVRDAASIGSPVQGHASKQPSPDYSPSYINPLASGNSSSGESIQAYLNRKIQSLEKDMRTHEDQLGKGDTSKASESEPLTLIPSTSFQFSPKDQSPSGQKVSFLGPPPGFSQLSEPERTQGSQKRPRIGSSSLHESHPPAKQRAPTPFRDFSNENSETDTSVEIGRRDLRATTCSSSEFMVETEVDSSHNPAGSTIAEALNYKSRRNDNESSDGGSMFTTVGLPETSKGQGLKSSSRALIKEHFQTNETFVLPQGHPVIAFTEDQLSSVLKIVADEAVRASQDALEGIIQKTRRLSLEAPVRSPATPATAGSRTSLRSRSTSPGLLSDTSGVLRSDEELSSIGYTYERNDAEQIFAPPRASGSAPSGHLEPRGEGVDAAVSSPGAQTLAALKAEAIKDKAKTSRSQRGRFTTSARGTGTRRKVTRSCKIMKEAYFKGMEWTRTFVSGPMDPRWNPYKFYCQICKANISIYGKGAREILRHHTSEKHLRKDQRWRYEYLYRIDPVTKTKIHQVRGKDGKLLSPYELEFELPHFINAPLVEIGQKLPFYDEYMAGTDYMSSSSDNRARIQLSVLAKFLPTHGDLEVLKAFWSDVGVIVNHQSLFTDFNWGKERISVSSRA